MSRKIIQIIPANGWVAFFEQVDGPEAEVPLICFALVEDNEDGEVVEMIEPCVWNTGADEFCRDIKGFIDIEFKGAA